MGYAAVAVSDAHANETAKMAVLAVRIGGGRVLVRRPMVLGPQGYFARVVRTRTLSVAAIGRPTVWSSFADGQSQRECPGCLMERDYHDPLAALIHTCYLRPIPDRRQRAERRYRGLGGRRADDLRLPGSDAQSDMTSAYRLARTGERP